MPIITESALKREIKSGQLARVYFLFGEEDFLVRTYAEMVISAACGEERDMNFVKYAQPPSPDELTDYLESVPFLADCKCVLIEDLDPDALDAAVLKSYMKILDNIPETSVLIIAQTHIDPVVYNAKKGKAKPKKLLEAAAKNGSACEFGLLSAANLRGLIRRRFERTGCTISDENAALLAEECGCSLTMLGAEIDKLSAYASGREITGADIAALVPKRIDAGIYTLTDAIFSGNISRAYEIFDELLLLGHDCHKIFSIISGDFIDLYRAKLAASAKKSYAEAAGAFGYPPNLSFRMKNAFQRAARLSCRYLADCVRILYDTNRLLNSSKTDGRLLIEKTIAELSRLEK